MLPSSVSHMSRHKKCSPIWLLQEQELEQAFERWEYLEALKNEWLIMQNSRFKQRQLTTVKLPDELGLSGMKTTLC